jgi:thiol-disulfide isomerase/thioredoxin
MRRRTFLSALAGTVAATQLRADPYAPPAATLARAATDSKDANALLITGEDGKRVPLSDYAGRLLVLNLWGPWCVPCQREMPSLSRLAALVDPERIVVLPLAFDWRGPAWVRRFYRENAIDNLPVLLGEGMNLMAVLGLEDLPTTVLLDGKGHHLYTVAGEARWDDTATIEWLKGLSADALQTRSERVNLQNPNAAKPSPSAVG